MHTSTGPKVSVVIAAYNCASWINQTVNDVLGQTFSDFELIVVDDGSTDNTGDVLKQIGDPRFKYVHQQNWGGPAKPRNTGLAIARGEYISFLDHDDRWYPERLQKVVTCFESDPSIDVVCHDQKVVCQQEIIAVNHYGPKSAPKDLYLEMLLKKNFLATSATTLKTTIAREFQGFNERRDLITSEDCDLWLRIAKSGHKFHFLHDVLGEYTLNSSNMTSNLDRHFNARKALYAEHIQRYPEELSRYTATLAGLNEYAYARTLQSRRAFKEANVHYWSALKNGYCSIKLLAGMASSLLRIRL